MNTRSKERGHFVGLDTATTKNKEKENERRQNVDVPVSVPVSVGVEKTVSEEPNNVRRQEWSDPDSSSSGMSADEEGGEILVVGNSVVE